MLTYLVMLILAVNVTAVEKVSSMRVARREVAPIGVMDKAAIPQEINFQGYLTDADADTALSGNYDMVFKIYDAGTGGNVLWNESWTDVSVDGGIFNVILGETQSIPDSVFLDYTNLWLELLIEGETLTPRQKIVSVGRAYKAAHADTANYAANAGASSTSAYADSSGISVYSWDGLHATHADTADYALAANVVSVDSATYADTSNYAISAGTAYTTAYADSAGVTAYAHEAGHATYADTAQYTIGGGSTAYADSAGVAAYAHESGHSVNSDTAQWSLGVGSVSWADSAGHLVVPDSLEATVNQGLNGVLWLKNNGTGSGIMVDLAGYAGVYVMNAVNSGYHVYNAGKVGFGVQNADVGFRSFDTDTGIYAKGTHLAGYFDGNVKVASNVTSDDFYRGGVTADSALMTRKYIDQQVASAGTGSYHAPTLTVSMSPDSTGDWVCDGTSDDVEIQAALDQINTLGGGVVYVKQGTYNLTNSLDVHSNTTLMGTGPGTVLNRTTGIAMHVTGGERVVIENLRVTGSCGYGIFFYDATDGEIKQCWVEISGDHGIILAGSGGVSNSHYNVIANNICNCSGAYCILIEGYENIIQGNNCRSVTSACIYLYEAESNVVVGNVVDGGGSAYGIELAGNSMDNTITGNTLIKGELRLSSSTWNTVSSNTVFQHQIYLDNGDWNTVVGNTVRGHMGGTGIVLSAGSDFNTINSNICYNHSTHGIYLFASSNNTVTDNVCTNNGQHGISITDYSDFNVVNDNRCVSNTSYGIRIATLTCDENVVQNNMLQGNTAGSYWDAGTNTRDDDAGATGGIGGHITGGTANYE
ncbi:hypothetical protein CH333_09840 [candidate division WOR-3 bacterium JGI_Cruoil_03_44_89]|uniref:Periplasmic copper-binding protein NosD beta helix domain-containing protein n=1 Tax=candidate division WOR-3 bacterium JGI_Cruoil_03_44_89 TaxID=1973748 RepID=A0A235BP93_UNCW3|nr:MAG: hypothetical protein CH333_09840 [candidate division WOR-3 bacterium JGI_Cruoil_03_44_89]